MIPAIEERGVGWEANEFLSTQIPSHFLFSLNFFFLNPKFQNLSPIMQCKREQMGKSYVGKGFGGPQRREIWLLNVSHTNLQLPPALPHKSCVWKQPAELRRSRRTAGGGGMQLENIGCACAALKIGIKSGAAAQPAKEKSIPRLACKMLSCTRSDPTWEPGTGTPQPVSLKEWPLHISTPPFRSRCV